MAIAFNDVNGSAKKGGYMKLEEGENVFRMVGGVLPRYLYWVKNSEKNDLPFECLGFDREKEAFTNKEKDWVQATVTDPKTGKPVTCGWAYAVQVINRKNGELEILNLKKKFFEALIQYCKDTKNDPTCIEKGFDVVVDRKKTGPFAYNVEYTVNVVKMMTAGTSALSEKDLELIKDLKSIDEAIPRPTSDEQKVALDAFLSGTPVEKTDTEDGASAATEAINELDEIGG